MLSVLASFALLYLQDEVNALECQDASRSFLITCLTIAAVVAVLAVLLKKFWDRRQALSPAARLGITLALAFALSSALVAWNPLKDETLLSCLESAEFSRYVLMAHVAAIPRGLVLGGLVSVGFYLLVMFVLGLRKR